MMHGTKSARCACRRRVRRGSVPISSARFAKAAIIWPRTVKWRRPGPAICLRSGSAGAYGAVQAGTYNTRLLIPEVLVNGDQHHVVRKRPSYEDLIGLDDLPPWLD
jgi:hypothetical protein